MQQIIEKLAVASGIGAALVLWWALALYVLAGGSPTGRAKSARVARLGTALLGLAIVCVCLLGFLSSF